MSRNFHCIGLIPCLLLAGCAAAPPRKATVAGPAAAPRHPGDSAAAATDPCAMRMQDISGAMLEYYVLNHRLPAALEELRTFAEVGTDMNFTCPASGRPYVYVPRGLAIPDVERRLILYDAAPVHEGASWGIVISPAIGNKPIVTWVIRLNHALLQAYLNGAPDPASVPVPVKMR